LIRPSIATPPLIKQAIPIVAQAQLPPTRAAVSPWDMDGRLGNWSGTAVSERLDILAALLDTTVTIDESLSESLLVDDRSIKASVGAGRSSRAPASQLSRATGPTSSCEG
jgi:hypothetical protein